MHRTDDVRVIKALREKVKANFNHVYWNGTAYRSPDYKEKTDERTNAMAVISGLADPDKYTAITNILANEVHASPYMEKYVLEALFMMDKDQAAMARMKARYGEMVAASYSTLWEGWCGTNSAVMGCDGTYNHGWSGGPLTLLSQYVAGISPVEPGFKKFKVAPHLSGLTSIEASVPLKAGSINVAINNSPQKLNMKIQSFDNAPVIVGVPIEKSHTRILINNEVVFQDQKAITNSKGIKYIGKETGFYLFQTINKYVNVEAY
jgi:alpha-L-rhamnosidase